MDAVKQKALANAQEYFADELRTVLEKHQVSAQEHSFNYLVSLLCRHIKSDTFFVKQPDGKLTNQFLVDLYNDYVQSDLQRKKVVLQRLGDVCLLISGFFAESLQRKTVDLDYYFGMGRGAYRLLSNLQRNKAMKEVYVELSIKFQPYSNVLNEMSERSGINSNRDLLRLYERWISTGSERIKNVLDEHGISDPIVIDIKIKH